MKTKQAFLFKNRTWRLEINEHIGRAIDNPGNLLIYRNAIKCII